MDVTGHGHIPDGSLPASPAGRLAFLVYLLHGSPVLDDDGEPTGEYEGGGMITVEDFVRLLEDPAL